MALISRSGRGGVNRRRRPSQPETRVGQSPTNRNKRQKTVRKTEPLRLGKGFKLAAGWLGTMCLCVAVFGFVSLGLLYGYRYVTNSSYFYVKSLEVQGNLRLPSREILDQAGLQLGMNSLLVSIDDVERKLAENPWVASVAVKRELPDGFTLRIQEKDPRFWLRSQGVLLYADAYGLPITEVTADKFAAFPTLEVEAGAEDLRRRLPELLASLSKTAMPVDLSSITRVRLSPGRGVEVFLEKEGVVLSIGQEDWANNLARLAATLTDLSRRGEMKDLQEVRAHGANVWVITKRPLA